MRLGLVTGLLALTVVATTPIATASEDALKNAHAAIEKANTAFEKEFGQGNAAAIAAMYTEGAIVFPPGAEMVKGRQAIEQFWKATMGSGVKQADLTTLDVGVSGDVAHEVGTVMLTISTDGKTSTTASAKYVVVWNRQADGSWKIHRDIWNDLPAKQ